ncbi:MAG: hypothetical protein RLY43_652 [Bacteroidota bacterium]|jgi:hypothetical protein
MYKYGINEECKQFANRIAAKIKDDNIDPSRNNRKKSRLAQKTLKTLMELEAWIKETCPEPYQTATWSRVEARLSRIDPIENITAQAFAIEEQIMQKRREYHEKQKQKRKQKNIKKDTAKKIRNRPSELWNI